TAGCLFGASVAAGLRQAFQAHAGGVTRPERVKGQHLDTGDAARNRLISRARVAARVSGGDGRGGGGRHGSSLQSLRVSHRPLRQWCTTWYDALWSYTTFHSLAQDVRRCTTN